MSKGIFRHVLKEDTGNRGYQERIIIDMPKDSKVLYTSLMEGKIIVWTESDTVSEPTKRLFFLYQDDMMIPTCPGEYVGTVIAPNAVFHVYDLGIL
jgi:hypothetical protein